MGSFLPGSTDTFGQADKAWEIPLRFGFMVAYCMGWFLRKCIAKFNVLPPLFFTVRIHICYFLTFATCMMSHQSYDIYRTNLTFKSRFLRFLVFFQYFRFFGFWTLVKPKNRFFKKTGIFWYTEKLPQPIQHFLSCALKSVCQPYVMYGMILRFRLMVVKSLEYYGLIYTCKL